MPSSTLLIPPGSHFWEQAARALCEDGLLSPAQPQTGAPDLSHLRVIVPGVAHIAPLRRALGVCLPATFVPPRIGTLSSWLALHAPPPRAASDSARMMALYAELRQHGWLKKLFAARRNTDLLPLAQTLITLFDELSAALLPQLGADPDAAQARWEQALAQLSPPARKLLSDEAQLVWTLWKGQLDACDPVARRLATLRALVADASHALVWIAPHAPHALEQVLLDAWAERQPVLQITLDWRPHAVAPILGAAWPEIVDGAQEGIAADREAAQPYLYRARSLEDEAQHGAHTVLGWLQQGANAVAIIAQDRVVARRMRALLERAQVYVADETGWKLSTTRSAAALVALLETAATRGETGALLDLLKSPFAFVDDPARSECVMQIEHTLRAANVAGGWDHLANALAANPQAQARVRLVATQAQALGARRTLARWSESTLNALEALGMRATLEQDHAGRQVTSLLDQLAYADEAAQEFSFPEWRAFLSLQLESTPFVPATIERRVVMLQLAGAPLRHFDAVLMVGADAEHLPSQPGETLFFANAVRRELGLATREQRQCLQLREFAELLSANPRVVLSWQAQRNGEPNAASTWIQRLELARAQAGLGPLPVHVCAAEERVLHAAPVAQPAPSAPHLLPRALSASAYNSLVACPYQFFAARMLALDGLDELSDLPQKRDYGEWLHAVLKTYHERVRDEGTRLDAREPLLRAISEQVFAAALQASGAALSWYARWQKVIPSYLAWANEREAAGWRFISGEEWREVPLAWTGGQVLLRGRIDRIDENEAGERAVLDYKTRNASTLRTRLKEGEDHQLAFYGLLAEGDAQHGHYVALELAAGKTGDAAAQDFEQWQQELRARLQASLGAIANGAPLPATGVDKVCMYCEMRGLCRKGAW